MGYFYAAMWLIAGLILIFIMSRENKVFYVAGGFFVLLGAWWFFDTLYPDTDMFSGAWGVVPRAAALIAVIVLAAVFYREHKRGASSAAKKDDE